MKKNLFFFSIIAIVLLVTTGCYIDYSDGSKDQNGNQIVHTIGSKVYSGEYVEKTEYAEYSAYVTVYVSEGKITKVELDDKKSNIVTSIKDWKDKNKFYSSTKLNKYLKSFEGKKVSDIKAYNHATADEKGKLDMITGVTVTSDRILKAVQNALNKI